MSDSSPQKCDIVHSTMSYRNETVAKQHVFYNLVRLLYLGKLKQEKVWKANEEEMASVQIDQ